MPESETPEPPVAVEPHVADISVNDALTIRAVADKPIHLRSCLAERSIGEFPPRLQAQQNSGVWQTLAELHEIGSNTIRGEFRRPMRSKIVCADQQNHGLRRRPVKISPPVMPPAITSSASVMEVDGSSQERDFPMIAISPCFRGGGAVSSLPLLAAKDHFIDPRHQLRRQRAGVGSGYALSKLLSVFHTKHKSDWSAGIRRARAGLAGTD